MKTQFEYKYIGKLNPIISYDIILIIILVGIFSFFFSLEFSKILSAIVISVILAAIVYTLSKIKSDDNVLLFTEEKLIHIKKGFINEYEYNNFIKIEFVKPIKNRSYIELFLKEKKFIFDIETKNGQDVVLTDFINFLFNKNEEILVNQTINLHKYKYVKIGDSVRSISLN